MVERAVIANIGRLPYDHTHPVVDEYATPYCGARMNFDPGQPAADMRSKAGQPFQLHAPQLVGQAVDDDGVKTGVGGDDFKRRARCRIAIEHDRNIFPELVDYIHTPEDAISE